MYCHSVNTSLVITSIIDIIPLAVLNLMRNDCQTSVIGDKTELSRARGGSATPCPLVEPSMRTALLIEFIFILGLCYQNFSIQAKN